MARRVKSAILDTRDARGRLDPRPKPYYVAIDSGLHLGYRKSKSKNRSGKWVLRSYQGNQDYQVETFATADDQQDPDGEMILDFWQAQAGARELHRRIQRNANGLQEPEGPYTVKQCTDDYLAWLEDEGKPRVDTETRIKNYVLPELGDIEVNKLTTKQIKAWRNRLAKRPPRARTMDGDTQNHRDFDPSDPEAVRKRRSTANRTLTVLKAALNRAWRDSDHIQSDQAWRKVEPFRNVDAARVRYLSVEEAQRLINACDSDLRALVRGALATGCRYGELARMNCADYDAANGTVHVLTSKSGKDRHVVLPEEGIALFDQLTVGQSGSAPIFRKDGGGRWGKSHQQRPFMEAIERAGIEPTITFHGLRHTYASLAVMNGAPLMVIAENLGHADTRMVEKHYGHLSKQFVKETIRATAPRFGMVEESNIERFEERS